MTDKKRTYLLRGRTYEEKKDLIEFKLKCGSNSMKGVLFSLIRKYNKK
tara:strand:+ start:424 stop:567 length:144 start_codon:yes stop_codon:yes gene_type:complete